MNRTPRAGVLVVLVAFALMLIPASAEAQANSPTITVADSKFEILTADDGTSTFTVTLAVAHVSDPTAVSMRIDGADPNDCVPLQQPILRPGVATKVTFELPASCVLTGSVTVRFVTFPFAPSIGAPSGVQVQAAVTKAQTPRPPWRNIGWGFGLGAAVAAAAVLLAWLAGSEANFKRDGAGDWRGNPWSRMLAGLDNKWSWSDSPLSSVTVAAAVFTAVLGASDTLGTILGEPGKDQVAVVVVAAATAAALTAAAPLALALFRREPPDFDTVEAPNNYTVLGVLLATLVVLAGNLGLILTVLWTLWDSSAINQIVLLGTAVGAATLVIAFTVRSMRRTLKIGMARLKRQQEEIGATEAAQPELVGPQFRQSRIAAMP